MFYILSFQDYPTISMCKYFQYCIQFEKDIIVLRITTPLYIERRGFLAFFVFSFHIHFANFVIVNVKNNCFSPIVITKLMFFLCAKRIYSLFLPYISYHFCIQSKTRTVFDHFTIGKIFAQDYNKTTIKNGTVTMEKRKV